MKTRITITLDEYEAELLDKAIRISRLMGEKEEPSRDHRSYVLRWIIRASCSAIIRSGDMPVPLAMWLRKETPKETTQRLSEEIPEAPDKDDSKLPPSRWN